MWQVIDSRYLYEWKWKQIWTYNLNSLGNPVNIKNKSIDSSVQLFGTNFLKVLQFNQTVLEKNVNQT